VKDLERSVDFYTKAVHLEVSERKDGRVYLRGGLEHHWLVIQEKPEAPLLERVGIEVKDAETMDAYEEKLTEAGVHFEAGNGLESDRVLRYIRLFDPSGNPLELYCDMVTMPSLPKPHIVHFEDIQHIVLLVHDFNIAHEFYTKVLGMRVSDYFEQGTAFMHFRNGWHHGIGIGSGRSGMQNGLSHICFLPQDLDMTMRGRAAVKRMGLKITSDLLKHGPSGSIGFYFDGPDVNIEFSYGARQFGENEVYKPRVLPRSPGVDVWQHGLEDLELSRPLQEAAASTP
jgi:catechol 2,3-dioxygenase-like lactoylglutathione lyase family enzyme